MGAHWVRDPSSGIGSGCGDLEGWRKFAPACAHWRLHVVGECNLLRLRHTGSRRRQPVPPEGPQLRTTAGQNSARSSATGGVCWQRRVVASMQQKGRVRRDLENCRVELRRGGRRPLVFGTKGAAAAATAGAEAGNGRAPTRCGDACAWSLADGAQATEFGVGWGRETWEGM